MKKKEDSGGTSEYSVLRLPQTQVKNDLSPLKQAAWIDRYLITVGGSVPIVRTELSRTERREHRQVRYSNKQRMIYSIPPGLYGIGHPSKQSPVFVSANYKLSFDELRRHLRGVNGWILVLDTRGINVWCAAGKGTFGTDELVRRIELTQLQKQVSHRRIIVPQLGAPGISAHRVKGESGFHVDYGPVQASSIPSYIKAGFKKSNEMHRIRFPWRDRLVLTPMEMSQIFKYTPYFLVALLLLNLFSGTALPGNLLLESGLLVLTILVGAVLTPLLLPFIPFRAFSAKGWGLGAAIVLLPLLLIESENVLKLAYLLLFPPLAAYLALNFTGSSTYTSLSGVVKEMRTYLPLMIVSVLMGLGMKIYTLF